MKSLVIGWDSRWGQLTKVWADSNSTTDTYRPYGLDCSGFVDWVFYNVTDGEYVIGHGGGVHMQHTYCTPISWNEAQPGDLVFFQGTYNCGDYITHVGIYVGDNRMYHAGNPIGFADLTSAYWQAHLVCAGRVGQ